MAKLISKATGNWNAAATWGQVNDTASLVLAYTTNPTSATTLTTSSQASASFTPGTITVEGFAVFMSAKSTGTNTITLELHDGSSVVASATMAQADLPTNPGWVFFKFASAYTMGAGAHTLRLKSSSSTNPPSFYTNGTAANWLRLCRTDGTAAPAAGDDMYIMGDTGPTDTLVVTFNETTATKGDFASATDYGSAGSAPGSQWGALTIDKGASLTWGATAATHYTMKLSGNLVVREGTYNMGTTGTPCPRDSSMVLGFDCGADGDYGFVGQAGCTVNIQGLSRTSGKNIVRCKLNTDEAAASTSLGVDTDTGWLDGDEIVIAGTSARPASAASFEDELRTLSGAAGASTLTISSGLTYSHLGTAPTQAYVVNLTRNVEIKAVTSTNMGYMDFPSASCTIDMDWVALRGLGTTTTNKYALRFLIGATFACNYCVVRDVDGIGVIEDTGQWTYSGSAGYTLDDFVMYSVVAASTNALALAVGSAGHTSGVRSVSNLTLIRSQSTATSLASIGNGVALGTAVFAQLNRSVGLASNNSTFSSGAQLPITGTLEMLSSTGGVTCGSAAFLGLTLLKVWRSGASPGVGLTLADLIPDSVISELWLAGNSGLNMYSTWSHGRILKMTSLSESGPTPATSYRVGNNTTSSDQSSYPGVLTIQDYDSTPSGSYVAPTTDISFSTDGSDCNYGSLVFINPTFAASTEVSNAGVFQRGQFLSVMRGNKTDNNDYTLLWGGARAAKDTTIADGGSGASLRVTPGTAVDRILVPVGRITVTDGVSRTVSLKVRESVVGDGTDYNGQRARLIALANTVAGLSADTVLDTATASSEGAWETLSGSISAPVGDTQVEIAVDCGGSGYSAGWVNFDTLSVS